jgi:hypothetical protein
MEHAVTAVATKIAVSETAANVITSVAAALPPVAGLAIAFFTSRPKFFNFDNLNKNVLKIGEEAQAVKQRQLTLPGQ